MGRKRFRDQIVAEILRTCDGNGASKTQVVYASGLNFATIEPYLAALNNNNLIEIISGSHTIYKITKKGKHAEILLRKLEKLLWS